MRESLGLIEVRGWSPALVVLDTLDKAASIRLIQVELNDLYGACIKIAGETADVQNAVAAGKSAAEAMKVECIADVINSPHPSAQAGYVAKKEFSPLIEQDVVHTPQGSNPATGSPRPASRKERMAEQVPFAIGMIETQGLTAVIEAIDTACKAASVEVIGREKLGGGYITVLIKGDVAAVKAAIEAGKGKVEGLGKLIAAHVIPRPSAAIMSLLPK